MHFTWSLILDQCIVFWIRQVVGSGTWTFRVIQCYDMNLVMWWPMHFVLSWKFLKDSTAYVVLHIIQYHSKFIYPPVSPGQEDGPNNPREQLLGRSTGGRRNIHIGWYGGMIQECWSVVPKIQVVANCYDKQKRSWRALISNYDVEEGRQSSWGQFQWKRCEREHVGTTCRWKNIELNILSLVVVRACLNVKQNWLPLSS